MASIKIIAAIDLIKSKNITAYAAAKIVGISVTAVYLSKLYQDHTGRHISTDVTPQNRIQI